MGNNAAFTAFEATVIAVYDEGVLTKKLLIKLMLPYKGVDIDHGGMLGTLSKDKMDVEEIVIKTFGKKMPVRPDLPKDYRTWTNKQCDQNEVYNEAQAELFCGITDKYGWG
jgi:hypothetical protein